MYSFSVVASPIIGYYMIKKGSFCLILYCDRNIILLVKCFQQSTSSKIINFDCSLQDFLQCLVLLLLHILG